MKRKPNDCISSVTLGIGIDVVDVARFHKTLVRFKNRFINRLFTADEIQIANERTTSLQTATYAKRFSAKEAVLKSLGVGYTGSIRWHDIQILRTSAGAPLVSVSGRVLQIAQERCPTGFTPSFLISLTDTASQAHASVLFQAVSESSKATPS